MIKILYFQEYVLIRLNVKQLYKMQKYFLEKYQIFSLKDIIKGKMIHPW